VNYFDDLGRYGANVALICEDGSEVTYTELAMTADAFGRQLADRGLVFILVENCPEAVLSYLGCLRARVPAALLAGSLHSLFLAALLDAYHPPYIWMRRERASEVWDTTEVYCRGEFVLLRTKFPPAPAYEALALLATTSGSTGSPKMVRLSYDNLRENAASIREYLGITADDRALTSLPMHYVYGLSVINSHLQAGASIALTQASLTEQRFWSVLRERHVTSLSGVP
jgi:acyl-CoA synthetase (AMP-forming)/AMP-acid ligase II